jgi:hypothetical protein
MLTLAEVLEAQRDLDRLCADRPRRFTERYEQNEFYGHADMLKHVAGLPQNRPLHVVIPHGVGTGQASHWDISTPAATAYSYQREYDAPLSRNGARALIQGAAPFVYLAEMLGPPPAARRGTLFFPAHTIPGIDTDAEYDSIAEMLLALPAELHPVRACIYWTDWLKGQQRPFTERGIEVVSAGHLQDPLFPWRLARLLQMHQVAASNKFGTHTFYALHLGCEYLQVQRHPEYRAVNGREGAVVPGNDVLYDRLYSLFPQGVPVRTEQVVRLADDMLGVHRRLAPDRLRALFIAAERRARLAAAA